MTFLEYIGLLFTNPVLIIISALVFGLLIVNGMTDAPNAIATCISTRSIKPRNAIIMASIFDGLGVFIMSFVSTKVASTIANMINFENSNYSLIALGIGIISAILWAYISSRFGIPTSESHALIAGITGAAIAISNGFSRSKF